MSDVVEVKKREETGTLRMRRMRVAGRVPAVIYGRGQDSMMVSIDKREVDKMMRTGRHIVDLGGDVSESALVKEVQWDAFGNEVLHIDLARVDASEAVEVSMSIETRGVAPGTRNGGVVKQLMQEVTIRCPADKLPESLEANINELELDGAITAGDLTLPPSAELLCELTDVVVTCVAPTAKSDDDEVEGAEAGAAEPEVIGRKADDEAGDDS